MLYIYQETLSATNDTSSKKNYQVVSLQSNLYGIYKTNLAKVNKDQTL